MKTMPILIAMLLVGNAVAGEPILDVDKIVAENKEFHQRQMEASYKLIDSIPSNIEAASPMKVDYSIITLPDGKTASVLTFK